MTFTVYAVPGSPFARAVLATLEEKGAPWRIASVAPKRLREPAHLARHPFGRVPVLDHDGFTLYETQAILRYLDRVLPSPPLTPTDPRRAARMDQVMNVSDWYLFQGVGNVIGFQRVIAPLVLGAEADEDACATAMPRAEIVFAELARLLGDGPWFGGPEVSLADLHLAPQMHILSLAPEWDVLTTRRAALRDWLVRILARASMQATTMDRVVAAARQAA
jgi:glutathione S-transferase